MNIEKLKQPLAQNAIAQRLGGGGMKLDYLESWFIIDQANEIFGFDGWSLDTQVELISTEVTADKTMAIYKCRALVRVNLEGMTFCSRTGYGVGKGISRNTNEAHELGIKEAESDAMKRAFRTFGNQFGNCLYDKEKGGVEKTGNSSAPSVVNTFAEKANGLYPDLAKGTPLKLPNDEIPFI
jgi:DNA repair and recombination protein RAD52